jgi:hypothetical protein
VFASVPPRKVPRSIKPRRPGVEPYEVYLCWNRMRDREACERTPVRRADVDDAALSFFTEAILDVDATVEQLRVGEDARRNEVREQRLQAERERLELDREREKIERDYFAGELSAKLYTKHDAEFSDKEARIIARIDQLQARDRQLSLESILDWLDAETTEALNAIRTAIVERVRGAADLDAVRAALRSSFEAFVLRGEVIEPRPRLEALAGFVAHEGDEYEPVYQRVALGGEIDNYVSSSPSQ